MYGVSVFISSLLFGCCFFEDCKIIEGKLNLRYSKFKRVNKN